jgi:hypothetical protein
MILSEKFKLDESSITIKTGSSESTQCVRDYEIDIPYQQFYMRDELINLRNFYEM